MMQDYLTFEVLSFNCCTPITIIRIVYFPYLHQKQIGIPHFPTSRYTALRHPANLILVYQLPAPTTPIHPHI